MKKVEYNKTITTDCKVVISTEDVAKAISKQWESIEKLGRKITIPPNASFHVASGKKIIITWKEDDPHCDTKEDAR